MIFGETPYNSGTLRPEATDIDAMQFCWVPSGGGSDGQWRP